MQPPDEEQRVPTKKAPPWKKPNPVKRSQTTHLTAEQKQMAKARADAAGRRYPNLIDNMAVAKAIKQATAAKRAPKRP
jgi:hypothetical protein